MDDVIKYPSNPLTAIENGCLLDLRVKLAVEFLKGDGITALDFDDKVDPARAHAVYALDLATALLQVAEERELVSPLPETDELTGSVRRHVGRNGRAALEQNHAAQRIKRESGSPIRVAMPMPGQAQ